MKKDLGFWGDGQLGDFFINKKKLAMKNVFEATLCREQKPKIEGNQKDMAL